MEDDEWLLLLYYSMTLFSNLNSSRKIRFKKKKEMKLNPGEKFFLMRMD